MASTPAQVAAGLADALGITDPVVVTDLTAFFETEGASTALISLSLAEISSSIRARLLMGPLTSIAGAATLPLDQAKDHLLKVTGSGWAISSFGPSTTQTVPVWKVLAGGAGTLVHGGSLILPGASNITVAAGDSWEVIDLGGNVWRVIDYTRADGTPIKMAGLGGYSFAAYLSAATADTATGDGTPYPIVCDVEDWDTGSVFSSGIFTAPVTGKYHFDLQVHVQNLGSAHTEAYLRLTTSDARNYQHSSLNPYAMCVAGKAMINMSADVQLDAGQTIRPYVAVIGGSKVIGVYGSGFRITTFSGHQIAG